MKYPMKYLIFSLLAILISCRPPKETGTEPMHSDPHSYSEPDMAKVTHLHWDAKVDFSRRVIEATATWDIQSTPGANEIVLDTKGLSIKTISLDNGQHVEVSLDKPDSLLGEALRIPITNETKAITITYATRPGAQAV